jgi:hypothetical protein
MQRSFFMPKDLQEAMQLQTEFLKAQYSAASERLNEMGGKMRSSSTDPFRKSGRDQVT